MLKLYTKCQSIRIWRVSIRTLNDDTNSRESSLQKRIREEMERDKQALKWRKSMEGSSTMLKSLYDQDQTSDYVVMMQKPISLHPKDLLAMWEKKKEKKERFMQQFIPERHEILGADLAAAHFILYRGGAVKFMNSNNWMKADKNGEFPLPSTYQEKFKLEALKCDDMNLYYEGLENVRCLQELKFLSFHNVKPFDDWCLDRVSGSQCPKLEILDISGTQCSARALACIYRLSNLKLLIVDDRKSTLDHELSCSMLEEALPGLKIADACSIHV